MVLAPAVEPVTAIVDTIYGASSTFTPVPVAVGDRLLMVIQQPLLESLQVL